MSTISSPSVPANNTTETPAAKKLREGQERTNRAIKLATTPNSQKDSAAILALSENLNSVPDISLSNLVYNSASRYQRDSKQNTSKADIDKQIKDLVATYKPASKR